LVLHCPTPHIALVRAFLSRIASLSVRFGIHFAECGRIPPGGFAARGYALSFEPLILSDYGQHSFLFPTATPTTLIPPSFRIGAHSNLPILADQGRADTRRGFVVLASRDKRGHAARTPHVNVPKIQITQRTTTHLSTQPTPHTTPQKKTNTNLLPP